MSAYGRWRDEQDRAFDAWWNEKVERNGQVRVIENDVDGFRERVVSNDAASVAKIIARNAWHRARMKDAPDD